MPSCGPGHHCRTLVLLTSPQPIKLDPRTCNSKPQVHDISLQQQEAAPCFKPRLAATILSLSYTRCLLPTGHEYLRKPCVCRDGLSASSGLLAVHSALYLLVRLGSGIAAAWLECSSCWDQPEALRAFGVSSTMKALPGVPKSSMYRLFSISPIPPEQGTCLTSYWVSFM